MTSDEIENLADIMHISPFDIPWIVADPTHPLHPRLILAMARRPVGASLPDLNRETE